MAIPAAGRRGAPRHPRDAGAPRGNPPTRQGQARDAGADPSRGNPAGAAAPSVSLPRQAEDRQAALRVRRIAHTYAWVILGLALVAILSRVYTTNSLAGEPTPDEYLYAVHARDLARAWSAGQAVSSTDLSVEGRSVAVEAAALSLVLPWDPLTLGRTLQALFNALCIPMTFVLGRQIGLPRTAALAGAVVLMAVPEFQELAWRFWTDSQATLLSLVYLSALVAFVRRPAVLSGGLALASLAGLVLTKESAAVTFTPFLALAVAIPFSRPLARSGRRRAGLAALLVMLVGAVLAGVLALAPADLAHTALLQKTFGAGPLILSSVLDAIPRLPAYSDQLTQLIGPRELGVGCLWAILVGFSWVVAQTVVAVATARPRASGWVLGWIAAMVVWALAIVTPARDLMVLRESDPWVAVAAGALLVAIGTVDLYLRNARRAGWGLALLGLVVLAVLAERLVISVTPRVAVAAALTFRSLMPIVPLLSLLAGGGIWAAAGAPALLVPSLRLARAGLAVATAVLLVTFWSPLLRERLSSRPLLGRVADRGADPDTPQGLRVEALVEAEDWLKANLRPTDVIITSIPRQLAWYADLGVDGMEAQIDLGAHPEDHWTEEQRRQYILDRLGPRGAAYLVDFNIHWLEPSSDAARAWRQTFDILAGRPNLEAVYVKRDKFGHPVFYVIRNHGFALSPTR